MRMNLLIWTLVNNNLILLLRCCAMMLPLLNIWDQGISYGLVGLQHQHGFYIFNKREYSVQEYADIFENIFTHKLLMNPTNVIVAEDVLIRWDIKESIIKALLVLNVKLQFVHNCIGSAILMTNKSALIIKMNYLETYCIPVIHGYPEFKGLTRLNMGEAYFVNQLREFLKKYGYAVRTDVLRQDAKQFISSKRGLVKEDKEARPVEVVEWDSSKGKELLQFNNVQRFLSICTVQPQPTGLDMDLKEVTKTEGSFKTVYKLPNYKSTLGWIVVPAGLNSPLAYCCPGWILERIYEGWFEGNQDCCTLADLILQSLLKITPDERLVASNNIIIQYPYNTPIYGLVGRLTKSIHTALPNYNTLKGISKHLNVRLFLNKSKKTNTEQELDQRISNTTVNSYTLEFVGLSVLLNNPSFESNQIYEKYEDLINIVDWMR